MKSIYLGLIVVVLILIGFTVHRVISGSGIETQIIEKQYGNTLEMVRGSKKVPRSKLDDGTLRANNVYNWTSGFFAGNLWQLYKLTNEEQWKNEAIYWTEILDTVQYWRGSHDVGFIINCSFGNAYELGVNSNYKDVLINAAESLSSRFNPKIGCIKSWNYKKSWDGNTEWFFPVNIDNVVTLEVLFKASKISGNPKYREIAISHALKTMKEHYRDDGSSYHVVDFDAKTGKVLDKGTLQGFSDESSWARGQAWGLYGFVMCSRETGDQAFLDHAQHIANYIINNPNIPENKIPYWDYHVGKEGYEPEWGYDAADYKETPRDVSAAVITASALFELSTLVEQGEDYYNYASEIIFNVSEPPYVVEEDEVSYFCLKHSVGSVPNRIEVSTSISFADYYYFEALLRKKGIDKKKKYD